MGFKISSIPLFVIIALLCYSCISDAFQNMLHNGPLWETLIFASCALGLVWLAFMILSKRLVRARPLSFKAGLIVWPAFFGLAVYGFAFFILRDTMHLDTNLCTNLALAFSLLIALFTALVLFLQQKTRL